MSAKHFLILNTQTMENYGLHDDVPCQRWKPKGGRDYLIAEFTNQELAEISDSEIDLLIYRAGQLVSEDNDGFREYVIGHELRFPGFKTEMQKFMEREVERGYADEHDLALFSPKVPEGWDLAARGIAMAVAA